MPYEITKLIMRQLFPKGVLPTAFPLIASGLLVLGWLVIKKEDKGVYKIVYDYLNGKRAGLDLNAVPALRMIQ